MDFDDLKRVWDEAAARPSQAIDVETLRRTVQERLRKYRRQILWRHSSEIGVATLLSGFFLVRGIWAAMEDGGAFSLMSVSQFTLAIGVAFVGSFLFVGRQRQQRREGNFDDSIEGNLQKLVSNTNYQIRLLNNGVWWNLFPLVPGMILQIAALTELGPINALLLGLFVFLIFGFVLWLHLWTVRQQLIPQRRELEALLSRLETNGGQTVKIRPASPDPNAMGGNTKIRKGFWVAVTAVCFGLVGWLMFTLFQPIEEPRAPEFDDVSAFGGSDIARIEAWLQEQVERSEYPSLSVVIVRDGKTVYQSALGYENTWTRRKATTNTAYHVASVTKAFTTSLAGLLHDRGVVDLDQPVVNYLPADVSISTQPELGATITLRQLASHTSGLPRGVPGRVQSVEGRYLLEPERLYGLLAKVKLEFNPGTDDLYSNLGFGLLGHALELAAGKPLDQLLQELLCDPLKLERTAIHVDDKLPVATGYSTPPQLPDTPSYRRRLAGSGGLVTSVGDLGKFLAAHMQPGLFTSEMLTLLHTETKLADGSEVNRALGWSIDSSNPAGLILSKNGGRNNCSAWIGFAPEHGIGVAVVANCGEPDVDPIGRWLLARSIPGGSKPATKHGYAKVAPYTGVRWENDRPIVRVQDSWAPLVSIDGIPMERIMEFANQEFGVLARKRFAEDLVELLSKMGHDPEWEVALGLETRDGQVEHLRIRMTEDNRDLVRLDPQN